MLGRQQRRREPGPAPGRDGREEFRGLDHRTGAPGQPAQDAVGEAVELPRRVRVGAVPPPQVDPEIRHEPDIAVTESLVDVVQSGLDHHDTIMRCPMGSGVLGFGCG
ncbi:hypothetical protein J3R03_005067 [Actinoplanes couchii]|nr:hypothetical protein [Actinoplanes couchii]MDR6320871.1 hypothetical protein [Actinoplanes couchii]